MKRVQEASTHPLQDTFFEAVIRGCEEFAVSRLVSRAAEQGVVLSKRDRYRLRARVKARQWTAFQLSGRDAKRKDDLVLRWSITDTHALQAHAKRILDAIPDLIESQSEAMAAEMLLGIRASRRPASAVNDRIVRRFRAGLSRRWRQPLQGLALMIALTREFSEEVGRHLDSRKNQKNAYLVSALTRLHARACQVASEVLVLLREGYADGAMARWRTLHELAVVAMYLQSRGECARHTIVNTCSTPS